VYRQKIYLERTNVYICLAKTASTIAKQKASIADPKSKNGHGSFGSIGLRLLVANFGAILRIFKSAQCALVHLKCMC